MAAKLILNPTTASRREISLSRDQILTIGRDPSNDLVLPDAMVSRRHAVIEHRGNQFFLRDCHSATGNDEVNVRMVNQGITAPGMKNAEEPKLASGQGLRDRTDIANRVSCGIE